MKRILLLFAVVASFVSCDPNGNSWQWWIENGTGQTLRLEYINYTPNEPSYGTIVIPTGNPVLLYRTALEKKDNLHFNDYFEKCARSYGSNVYWRIMSEDGAVLKTWNYANKDLPDQRFFEESSWSYDHKPGHGHTLIEYSWTFTISQEDIQKNR